MIKFNIGKISAYLLIYALSWIVIIIFLQLEILKDLYIIIFYLVELGQISLSIYLYQEISFNKNKHIKYFGLKLIHNKADMKSKDKPIKILILIFFSSIFDFFTIIIEYYCSIEINEKISLLFKFRIGVITTIVSSFVHVL